MVEKFYMAVKILFIATIILYLASLWDYSKDEECIISNDEPAAVITEHEEGYLEFVVNLSTKKYHIPSCRYADIKKEENKGYFKSEEFLMEHGYEPCKKCVIWRYN